MREMAHLIGAGRWGAGGSRSLPWERQGFSSMPSTTFTISLPIPVARCERTTTAEKAAPSVSVPHGTRPVCLPAFGDPSPPLKLGVWLLEFAAPHPAPHSPPPPPPPSQAPPPPQAHPQLQGPGPAAGPRRAGGLTQVRLLALLLLRLDVELGSRFDLLHPGRPGRRDGELGTDGRRGSRCANGLPLGHRPSSTGGESELCLLL